MTERQLTHDERVLRLLSDGHPHTHHELYGLHVVAHSRVASLRRKGYRIDAWRDGDLYLYRLVGTSEQAEVEPVEQLVPSACSDAPAPAPDTSVGASVQLTLAEVA